ncbi:hypothetical protein TH53_24525, partial [Pedobacter lusitanus]
HTWLTIKDNKRMSSWVAFLQPVKNHPNLTLLVGAQVNRILFSGNKAIGISYTLDNGKKDNEAYATAFLAQEI